VLEPASWNIPVLFGKHQLTEDAKILMDRGSGISIGNAEELYDTLFELLTMKEKRIELGLKSGVIFKNRRQSSRKIAELITEF